MKVSAKSLARLLLLVLATAILPEIYAQTINISPKQIYFGRIPEGKMASRDLLIYNISSKALKISNLRIEGSDAALFTIPANPGSVTLGIAQKLVLPIEFRPLVSGSFSARIVVESNASTSPDQADLTGEATDLTKGFVTFERIFGSPEGDGAGSIRETADGGFLIVGSVVRLDQEYSDATLTKMDRYGQVEWSQWYGQEEWSEGLSVGIPLPEGGYIAVGSHANSQQRLEPNVYALKTDASGTLVWEKSYGKSDFRADGGSDIIPAGDGGFLIAGYTQTQQDKNAYLIKINAAGGVIWEKTYGGAGGEDIDSIKPTADGGFIFVGSTSTNAVGGSNDFDIYLVKISASGDVIWEKSYGGTDWDRAGGFILTPDGGFLIAGYTASPEFGAVARDAYLLKLDASAVKEWQERYGWEHKDGAAEVIATEDGGYLLVGSSERYYDATFLTWRSDLYIVKTDARGKEGWSKTFGGLQEEGAECVRQVSDGGYIISGTTSSYSKDSDIYLLKLRQDGAFTAVETRKPEVPGQFSLEQNYPNPFNDRTMLRYHLAQASPVSLQIFNLRGERIADVVRGVQQAGSYQVPFDARDLASGLYVIRLQTNQAVGVGRMLLIK
jgi:hypothetical protein